MMLQQPAQAAPELLVADAGHRLFAGERLTLPNAATPLPARLGQQHVPASAARKQQAEGRVQQRCRGA